MINTRERSIETEWMDDLSVSGDELHKTLDQIARLNQLLGGNHITLDGVKRLLHHHNTTEPIHIVDLGCGNGDLLRALSKFGKKHNYTFKLTGIDANEATIQYAISLSQSFSDIEYRCMDFFSDQFKQLQYDIALATLVMHHFEHEELDALLKIISKHTKLGVVINDLHRHKLAYYLFKLIGIFIKSKKARQDGLISILRGFKNVELQQLSNKLNLNSAIKWKWAFRYQWIIKK